MIESVNQLVGLRRQFLSDSPKFGIHCWFNLSGLLHLYISTHIGSSKFTWLVGFLCLLFSIKLLAATFLGLTDFDCALVLAGAWVGEGWSSALVLAGAWMGEGWSSALVLPGAWMGESWSSMEQEKKFTNFDGGVLVVIP